MNIKSKEILVAFAKTAAIKFTQSKVPLNDTLIKIAGEEGLIPDQVDFLVQETNKQAWSELYRTNKDAAYDFPLADSSKVLNGVRDDFSVKKVKDYDVDYMSSPSKSEAPLAKVASSVEGRSKKEIARELSMKLEKLADAKSDLQMKFYEHNTMAENESEKIVKLLRNELLEMPFSKRAEAFKKFACAAYQTIPAKETIDKIAAIQYVLEKQSVMVKTAAHEAPEDLISKNMPATIINGNNEIIVRVKTLMQYTQAAADSHSRLSLVDDTIPKVKEALREL